MKFQTYEKIMKILTILIIIAGICLILKVSEKRTAEIMSVDWCFQETINDELEPVLCSELEEEKRVTESRFVCSDVVDQNNMTDSAYSNCEII